MKKVLITLFAFIMFSITSYAGDMPESLMSDENVKIFTATVLDVKKDYIELKVAHKIMGDIFENDILSVPYFEYSGRDSKKPAKDDRCVVTVKDNKAFYGFKATSTDPKTLKLINHLTNKSMNMLGESQDERFLKYINNGEYERADQKRIAKKAEEDKEIQTTKESKEPTKEVQKTASPANEGEKMEASKSENNWIIYIVAGASLFFGVIFYVIINKRKQ
ncbi:hypothetical protein [Pseudobacteroides cellulosolvens]|uniref:Uncharacterized protein n=1 Tax=Pseudobacteroides cellulosolvens ATCC 35603 = DSM 2933 TaxID=398512 RepID=A0A0L6JK53_9FIRM|nr:hypothetical protein [Pseudobacteroides cellulosolvens]KNY26159.1 hypothetical protein Bccel_1421 [Pseudobacteroides cellulosolvens ATCC 35603 = DSM 2933]